MTVSTDADKLKNQSVSFFFPKKYSNNDKICTWGCPMNKAY